MKLFVLAALALAATGSAYGADETPLAKKSGCFACHEVDKKLVGPSYRDVANKYRGDKTAEAKLIEKVKKGGSGVWGPTPMIPNSLVSDKDIKTLVEWVLSLQ
jgi:cytochrome c